MLLRNHLILISVISIAMPLVHALQINQHVDNIIFDTDIPMILTEVRFLRRNSLGSLREYLSKEEFLPIATYASKSMRNRSLSLQL